MKKMLLSLLTFSTLTATAQCVIDQNAFSGPNDYGIEPTSAVFNGSAAATGTELVAYATTLQVHLIADTTIQGIGTFTVQSGTIDGVSGLPTGITFASNPSGTIMGGGYACIQLSGTPAAGTAAGGPNNDGIYPITVTTTMTVDLFSVPTPFPYEVTDYEMRVQENTTGLFEMTEQSELVVVYNGTDASAYVLSSGEEAVAARIVDVNGSHVQSLTLHNGTNTLEMAGMKPGLYFVEAGNSVVRLMKF